MKAILVNYNFDPEWIPDYPIEPVIYDRSDDRVERDLTRYGSVYKTANTGDVDFDKLSYLVEHYHDLPEVFLWSKTNIFKFVDYVSFKKALQNKEFAPLLKYDHKIYSDQFGEVNKYVGTKYGLMYAERADSWYFHAGLDNAGRFKSWQDWALHFRLPQDSFVPFAPGGSYILTREAVHKHSRDVYEEMRDTLPYAAHPVEAHCCERSYFYLWS